MRLLTEPFRENPKKATLAALALLTVIVLTIIVFQPAPETARVAKAAPEKPQETETGTFGAGSLDDTSSDNGTGQMTLTIPKFKHIQKVPVPTAPADDLKTLDENTAVHMEGTGFPWQKESNVYLSGHRMGYKNTPSWHAFRDLDKLETGDIVILAGPKGAHYTYEVYETLTVEPSQIDVIQPVEDKDIVSLQTCTLPDYTQRLIVRAQRVEA